MRRLAIGFFVAITAAVMFAQDMGHDLLVF